MRTALVLFFGITVIGAAAQAVDWAAEPRPQQASSPAASARSAEPNGRRNEFYFTRAIYSDRRGGFRGRGAWSTDWPKADIQFLSVLRRLAREIDANESDNAIRLDDPNLRRFPFVYAVEVGNMALSDPEVKALREFLLAGGILFVDDFWGTYEWQNFEHNIRRVLPEYQIVDLPLTHPLFHSYYSIKAVEQVPNIYNGCNGGPYFENDGYTPMVRGIFDEHQRLMVLISYNSDMGDAWEHMEQSCYPLKMSTYAYEFAVNAIVYSMSH